MLIEKLSYFFSLRNYYLEGTYNSFGEEIVRLCLHMDTNICQQRGHTGFSLRLGVPQNSD